MPKVATWAKPKVVTFGKASPSSPCKRDAVKKKVYRWNKTELPVKQTSEMKQLWYTKPATLETEEMSTVPVLAMYNKNVQITTLKSMVLDLRWFDRDRTKFED